MDLINKRFLVIGGAGFIGSRVVENLLKHDVAEVIVYDNFVRGKVSNLSSSLKDPRVSIYEVGGDILQPDILDAAMKGVDGVFHLAALWLLQCADFPHSAFKTNIEGTFNVLEACVKNGVKRLIYSSSASVYGDAVTEPMTEDHPFNNTNFYGATKISGEAMLTAYCHRYGLNAVGLRYMNVYGPGQDTHGAYVAVIVKMFRNILQNNPIEIDGDGSQCYDFIYVNDCARSNIKAMIADQTARFYNVGTGIKTSIKALGEKILEVSGSDKQICFNEKPTRAFVTNRVGCTKRASSELDFQYSIDLHHGLALTYDWIKETIGSQELETLS